MTALDIRMIGYMLLAYQGKELRTLATESGVPESIARGYVCPANYLLTERGRRVLLPVLGAMELAIKTDAELQELRKASAAQ